MEKEQKYKKNYYKFISIARGIGILLVVLGHCSNSYISNFIYLFHIPLFFFISGFLFNLNSLKAPKEYVKRKIISLYVPYVFYEMLFLVLNNFLININFYSISQNISGKSIGYLDFKMFLVKTIKIIFFAGREPIVGALWFLVVLFFVSILFLIINLFLTKINKENDEKTRFLIFLSLFIFGNFLTRFGYTIPRFNNTLVMLFIYYLGFLTKTYFDKIKFENTTMCIISIILLSVNYFYGSISVNDNTYLSPDFLIVNTFLGVYAVFYLSKKIQKLKIGNFFEILGNNSLEIMALHIVAFKIASIFIIQIFDLNKDVLSNYPTILPINNIYTIIYLVFGIFLPLIFVKCYKFFKNILLNLKILDNENMKK